MVRPQGLPASDPTLAELQLVACSEQLDALQESCSYEGKDGVGAYTITFYQRSERITVRDARTLDVLGERSFEGTAPSTACDQKIEVRSGDTSRDVHGDMPDRKAMTEFVRPFVDAPPPS